MSRNTWIWARCQNEAATRTFLPEGRAPVAGEIFSNVDLAATISAVAERGADAFYKGEIAASIARSTQEAGGYLSEEDLAAHESTFVEPISTDYRGVRVYRGFGSGIVAEGTGVCLHNRGKSFRLEPGHPNAIAPGKRPMHTLIPGLATSDGALWAVFGVMGAAMQPQGHAQVLIDLLDYGMDPQEAVEHPRHRHENGVLLIEGRVPEEEIARLRGRGHRIEVREDFMIPAGGAQLIRILDNGVRACGSDPRKDGCALAQ